MGSLKLRLAVASAVLIACSVAGTVLVGVHQVERGLTEGLVDSNLGAAQLAGTLSESVVERQRALLATARQWPREQLASPSNNQAFLDRHAALTTLFNRVQVAPLAVTEPAGGRFGSVSAPKRGLPGMDEFVVAMQTPIASDHAPPMALTGLLHLKGDNFLSNMPRLAQLDDIHLQTFVADQKGLLIAHANPQRLLASIDDDPDLRAIAAQWRAMGSPLEPTPWTGRFGKQVAAMAAVPGTDWMVFRVADGDALFGSARRAINNTIWLSAGIAMAGALTIFGLAAWLLRPMGELRQRALLALDPTHPAQVGWPESGGEVGELSRVLKYVSEQLAVSRGEIEQSLQQMQAVLAHAPVGIAFSGEYRIELASSHLERMLGYGAGELKFQWGELVAPEGNRDALRELAESTFQRGQVFQAEVPLVRRDGSTLWTLVHGAAIFGEQRRTIWIVTDATEVRRKRASLEWTAAHDPLTELVNRREFEQRLEGLLDDRRRHDAACALFIDLDHFKQVNDGAGHAAGDAILKKVANVLRDSVRSGDTVCRLGGDEFAVLLPACGLDRAMLIAEQMRYGIALEGVCESDSSLRVTASIGVVEIDTQHLSLSQVLEAADRACYAAKHAGRNVVHSAAAGPADEALAAAMIADGLQQGSPTA